MFEYLNKMMNFWKKEKKNYKQKQSDNNNNNEVFLDYKRKKTWEDPNSGHKCFMLYARSLYVTHGGALQYWTWNSFKDTSDENIEVAKLRAVCWLDVRGKLKISELSPGTWYDVVYAVKLTKGASGWELPVKLRLSLPNGRVQVRQVSLLHKPRQQWIELNVSSFCTRNKDEEEENGEVCFDVYEHGGHWKSGLVVRGAILRPNNKKLNL